MLFLVELLVVFILFRTGGNGLCGPTHLVFLDVKPQKCEANCFDIKDSSTAFLGQAQVLDIK